MDEVIDMMKEMLADMKEMKSGRKELINDIKEIRKEWSKCQEEITKLKNENGEMKNQINALYEHIENIEKRERKKNIIITGLQLAAEEPKQLKEEVRSNIKKYIGLDSRIKSVSKLSKKICKVELDSTEEKEEIMKNKTKLRQTQEMKIFINDDLTTNERNIQKKIRDHARQQRDMGKRVITKYQKLIIENEIWTWDKETGKLVLEKEKSSSGKNSKNW